MIFSTGGPQEKEEEAGQERDRRKVIEKSKALREQVCQSLCVMCNKCGCVILELQSMLLL